ncbi:hypothetical protein A2875_02820 [Candidatus Gottesmanbacteria bacterium RIFCSPHIGHO2_01_FULL_46_14]|uniref:DUF952 domain-containing protein n=4 Tax=Microgenomates group TaxID=1794810 RepID=A0A1F5ZQQ9_9BACT|nr:MAG: hypothetical protein UU34_C0005G0018 [Candidatus Curtissbacteria bacterium GW2011_GWA1_41_11]KKS12396.1 MAG: hypothetical protein UU67_C0054G0006 [Candidatus Daviesbacteria bacterium GW2011_GWB1_41_5]OGG14437.1 MAG: hypothetical protein A2875_02820 [Candidatus Gottesmanbacteria bacterium RIFCSPHIGHO2_01_FULL_46_14]OGG28546.1 MAG: hypothetical protein A2971_03615 [Candidatus Gottesmanbacteria bacterium RIFCSPLOWO2_01_FULL_46_21]
MKVFHLVRKDDWEKRKDLEYYAPPSLEREGFIHCSTVGQVLATASRRFSGVTDLLILIVNSDKVPTEIVYEDLRGTGEKHPHIYGPLSREAIEKVIAFLCDKDGEFTSLPIELDKYD